MPDTSPDTADKAPQKSPEERVRHGLARTSKSLATLANVETRPEIRSDILRLSMELSELEARAQGAHSVQSDETF